MGLRGFRQMSGRQTGFRWNTPRWSWPAVTRNDGAVRPSSAATKPAWAQDSPSSVRRIPSAYSGNAGTVRRLPGTLQDNRERRGRGGRLARADQFPARPAAVTDSVAVFPPDRPEPALAAFLLQILLPGHLRPRPPGRNSPRKSKKVGDFPARKPDESGVTNAIRKIQFYLLKPWMIT